MKLTDKEIESFCTNEVPLIKPFNEKHLTPNGYDLLMDEIEIGGKVQKICGKEIRISPKTPFRIMTMETINLPTNLVGQLWLRSTYARKGIMATFGFIDAGYCGKLAFSLYNSTDDNFIITRRERICQIVFERFSNPEQSYEERSGNYQNQKSLKG